MASRSGLSGFVRVCSGLLIASTLLFGCSPEENVEPSASETNPNQSEPTRTNPNKEPSLDNMVYIEGGTFMMGSDANRPDELPIHEVTLDGFWMDKYEVTNADFAKFVEETGHVTTAEQYGNSILFIGSDGPVDLRDVGQWWSVVDGVDWRHPEGPGSNIDSRMDHPVVHVSWNDAKAYAEWAGKSLPTEAQFEYAAKLGTTDDPKTPEANIFQGTFPYDNNVTDGFEATAPVGSFPPNSLGMYDLAGNVWEWCLDWYRYDAYLTSEEKNPSGPSTSYDPEDPRLWKRVTRGGSYLCHESYCSGYLPTTRMKTPPDDSHSNTGFRCVVNGARPE